MGIQCWDIPHVNFEAVLRHDRYEGKPLFWVEEDLQAEYEKTASRTRREQAEYQVSAPGADVFADAHEAMTLDMSAIAGGQNWHAHVMVLSSFSKYRWGFALELCEKTWKNKINSVANLCATTKIWFATPHSTK